MSFACEENYMRYRDILRWLRKAWVQFPGGNYMLCDFRCSQMKVKDDNYWCAESPASAASKGCWRLHPYLELEAYHLFHCTCNSRILWMPRLSCVTCWPGAHWGPSCIYLNYQCNLAYIDSVKAVVATHAYIAYLKSNIFKESLHVLAN